jgi:hypothetical protein
MPPTATGSGSAWLRRATLRQPRELLHRMGVPGAAAIGLLTACAAFYASVLLPLDSRIDEVRDNARELAERVLQPGGLGTAKLAVAEQLAEFHRLFPHQATITDMVSKVFAAAQAQGIVLAQGEYRVADDPQGGLRRFQMLLPVKAEYTRIRLFLSRLALDVPTAALEHIQFERQRIGDTQVEATIKLTLYVEPAP